MKRMKKLLAVMLAAIMVMSMTTSVFADANTQATTSYDTTSGTTLTITGVATASHTFTAYQIFAGTLSGTSADNYVLSDIKWGDCVNGTTLLAYLTNSSNTDYAYGSVTWYSLFGNCTSAADVAAVLTNYDDDSDLVNAFAALVSGYLTAYTNTSGSSPTAVTDNGVTTYTYTISDLAVGYYLVVDTTSSASTAKDEVSDYFLQVLGNTSVATKAVYPTVDKVITNSSYDDSTEDDNSAAIGDIVYYTITVSVPDISDYTNGYVLKVNDTLDTGLAYNSNSLTFTITGVDSTDDTKTVAVASSSLTSGTDYTVNENSGFVLSFSNLYSLYTSKGIDVSEASTITVNYSATVVSGASIGTNGNENAVNVTYSNDPNYVSGSSSGDGTGTSETEKTYTYITSLVLYKYTSTTDSGNTTYTPLSGAEFDLYMVDSDGTYYQLSDGTFTTTAPTSETLSNYVVSGSDAVAYSKVNTSSLTTGANGTVSLTSLAAGSYVLVETKAPAGYNALSGNIAFTVSYTEDTTAGTATWTMTITDGTSVAEVLTSSTTSSDSNSPTITTGNFGMSIFNASGAQLPTTGGIGTTMFYVVGMILVLGAAVVLVTRRRMGTKA